MFRDLPYQLDEVMLSLAMTRSSTVGLISKVDDRSLVPRCKSVNMQPAKGRNTELHLVYAKVQWFSSIKETQKNKRNQQYQCNASKCIKHRQHVTGRLKRKPIDIQVIMKIICKNKIKINK